MPLQLDQHFSPCRGLPSATCAIFLACVWSPLATTLVPHMFLCFFHVRCCIFRIQRYLLAAAHHAVRCLFPSNVSFTKVHFPFGLGLSSSQSFHSSTRQWKLVAFFSACTNFLPFLLKRDSSHLRRISSVQASLRLLLPHFPFHCLP